MPWNWKTEAIGIQVSGAPAVSSWKEGRLDVFIHSTDNRLFHRVFENDSWQGANWRDLTDGLSIESSPAAVSWSPDRIDLFVVSNKQVHHRAYQSGMWSPWTENLDGVTHDWPAAASGKPLRVDVLVHTSDHLMARRYWEAGVPGGFQNWETVGGTTQNLMSAPAAVATAPNRVDCFGRGSAGRLIHAWYQGIIQEHWSEIDTLLIQDTPGVVSATTSDRGRVDVFVRGTDDLLKHRVFYTAQRRSEPPGETAYIAEPGDYLLKIARKFNVELEALKVLNPQIPPPDYPVKPGDRIVIARHESESVHSEWEPGSSWENLSANRIASAPAAVGWWSGNILKRIDCFAQSPDGQLIHTWWT
jgi:hypothetical protein